MAASTASSSFCPPRAKNLIPLSGMGLWDAEMTTPRSASTALTRYATAGVGTTPASSTSTPALARPAATAAERNSPGDPRVPAEDRGGAVAGELAALGEDPRRRDGEFDGKFRRDIPIRDAADTVGAEQARHARNAIASSTAGRGEPS